MNLRQPLFGANGSATIRLNGVFWAERLRAARAVMQPVHFSEFVRAPLSVVVPILVLTIGCSGSASVELKDAPTALSQAAGREARHYHRLDFDPIQGIWGGSAFDGAKITVPDGYTLKRVEFRYKDRLASWKLDKDGVSAIRSQKSFDYLAEELFFEKLPPDSFGAYHIRFDRSITALPPVGITLSFIRAREPNPVVDDWIEESSHALDMVFESFINKYIALSKQEDAADEVARRAAKRAEVAAAARERAGIPKPGECYEQKIKGQLVGKVGTNLYEFVEVLTQVKQGCNPRAAPSPAWCDEEFIGPHALVHTKRTNFASTGEFTLCIRKAATTKKKVTLTNGFTEIWNVYTEDPRPVPN